jgi:general L-amino acid transport system permease protein
MRGDRMTVVEERRSRPPFWRDVRVLRVVAQLVAVAGVATILYVLWFNLTNNMRARGIPLNFDFLRQPMGVNIAGSNVGSSAPIWRGLQVGIKNTFALVVVGIPLLTIIGVLVGIARLSTNWLVAKAAALYVEVLRNIPPLLIIIFAFNAGILQLPRIENSGTPLDLLVVNNRFIAVTGFTAQSGFWQFWALFGVALIAALGLWMWRTRRSEATGEPHHRVLWALGLLLVVGVVGFIALGEPFALSRPILDGRVLEGGYQGLGAYFAVLIALVLYTASHVAEIVRGSILAVPRGQTEAANAVALTSFQRLRFVVLPQAMRIAIPPIISQYLNFTKNTSLAVAIGYAEITRLTFQAIGNGRPAVQLIAILMGAYLLFSLTISFIVNLLNRRLRYVT